MENKRIRNENHKIHWKTKEPEFKELKNVNALTMNERKWPYNSVVGRFGEITSTIAAHMTHTTKHLVGKETWTLLVESLEDILKSAYAKCTKVAPIHFPGLDLSQNVLYQLA